MELRTIPIRTMALRLAISPERALRLVTTRKVAGMQNARGCWLVVESDVERLERNGLADPGPLVAAGGAR
jgi:hypothetical protein